MEIVCAPETYRRFESSSLRQKKRDMPSGVSLFLMLSNFLFFDKKLCSALGNIDLHLPKFVAAIQ